LVTDGGIPYAKTELKPIAEKETGAGMAPVFSAMMTHGTTDNIIAPAADPKAGSVAELVASQAAATPDALALTSATRILSYKELDERASALADVLRALGVGPDVVVGLCAPRSAVMVVGALGILKAGGAYLPLDPTYPAARLAFVLDDGPVPVVVTGHCVKDQVPTGTHQTILLDDLGRVVHSPPLPRSARTKVAATLKNLAYVIYTSGSTGQPKGVEITHESLLNLVHWHQHAFQLTSADRASQVAKVGFDAAVWEIWPYLASGASLHMPDDEMVSDPESLRNWLVAQGITISFIPTPMAERLLTLPWPSGIALRTMLTGADTLHGYPPVGLPFLLVNNYGLTECAVVTTSGPVYPNGSTDRLPAIGRAITNTQVYILDESDRQVSMGTIGELHVGGLGVARGYRNRPELTAKKFIPNPFRAKPGERLFKTGDLAKFLPDGQIAFLGHMHDRIKVRGFRVEPNEVVAALNMHPHIEQSVVVAREGTPGDTRLIGYFVSVPQSQLTLSELRNFLGARLPDFMVPAKFVRLEKLPLIANGKIDRMSLPPADDTNTLRDNACAAPGTDMEKTVAGILARLLELEHVDLKDNFFSLGGHSLLGAQLIARVRDTFGIEMPLRVVFEAPTVSELSAEIERLLVVKLEAMSENGVGASWTRHHRLTPESAQDDD
jgi:amino acid adenylation domain-containing protein